jgi:hypothetical protein
MLMNLMENLRERFVFREVAEESSVGESHPINIGRHGNYFANAQDVQLYNDVSQLLEGLELIEGSDQIRRTLEDSFHALDYDALRSLLNGVQRLLELLRLEGKEEMNTLADAVCHAFRLSCDRLKSDRSLVFEQLDLPTLTNSQAQQLLALQPCELVELVRFAGSQLASEAYLFAKLPLCLKEPLGAKAREELEASVNQMKEIDGLETALSRVNELVRDILSFYEQLISREVLSSTQSLRGFFLKNNALDRADPIFALIPSDLTLRNYVSLRCHLHQLKLSLMYDHHDNDRHMETEVESAKSSLGRCWLWDEDNNGIGVIGEDVTQETQFYAPADPTDLLWFARGLEQDTANPAADDMSVDEEQTTVVDLVMNETTRCEVDEQPTYVDPVETSMLEEDTQSKEENAAANIQRWWRRLAELEIENHLMEHYVMEDLLHEELSTSSPAEDLDSDDSQESSAKRARLQENKPKKTDVEAVAQDAEAHYVPTREIDASPAVGGGTATIDTSTAAARSDESIVVWTSESLYSQQDSTAAGAANKSSTTTTTTTTTLYGNENDETCMRRWLNEHNLPQSVGDFLLNEIGARRIDDVVMVVEECESSEPELLVGLKPLDRIKLKKAVQAYTKHRAS